MPVKYVFVTGGVVSGLGKGITAASLGRLLKARGYKVTMQKFDPYINIDPGTMNPVQHGEVFVTDDGAETDLDLGHYERFIDESLTRNSNVTTGKVYWTVLHKERRGDFGGGTVQVIPHITNEIKSRFHRNYSETETEIAIIEVGGTVGDIESQPFLEAIRQFQHEAGPGNTCMIHVTLIPYLKASGELKTKPTQASVKDLQGMGIQPDILVCRSERPLDEGNKNKIALFCNVPPHHVLQKLDVDVLYEVPLVMEQEHLAQSACECLNLPCLEPDLTDWQNMIGLIICIFHAWDCKQYLCLFQHHTGHGGNVFSNHIHSIVVHNAGAFLLAKAHCHHFAWPALISSAKRIISSAKRIVGLKPAGYDNAVRFICIPVNKHPSASLRNPKLHHLHGGADRASHGFRGNIIACQHLQLSLCRSAPMASHGRHAGELYLCIYPHHPLPVLAINTIHALSCGLLFAGIISATMSSSDSDLLGAGSIFANDIKRKPQRSCSGVFVLCPHGHLISFA